MSTDTIVSIGAGLFLGVPAGSIVLGLWLIGMKILVTTGLGAWRNLS